MTKHTISKDNVRSNIRAPKGVKGKIRAKIDIPGISVDIDTNDSLTALREVRKILDSVRSTAAPFEGDFEEVSIEYPQRNALWSVSEEAKAHEDLMEFVRLASKAEECVAYKRLSIPNKRIVDVNEKRLYAVADLELVKNNVRGILAPYKNQNVRFAAIHVMGNIADDEKVLVGDIVGEEFGKTDTKKNFTNKDVLGKTIIEILLFGNFTEDL